MFEHNRLEEKGKHECWSRFDGPAISRVVAGSTDLSGKHEFDEFEDRLSRAPATVSERLKAVENNRSHMKDQPHATRSGPIIDIVPAPSTFAVDPPPSNIAVLAKRVEDLTQIVGDLVHKEMTLGFGDTEQVNRRHKWFLRTLKNKPGQLLSRVAHDLTSADQKVAQTTTVMHNLLGG